MTTRIATQNSTYEVDEENKRIRRLDGVLDPTPSQGTDGEWQPYTAVTQHPSGVLVIEWPLGEKNSPYTVTSRIQTIEENQ